MKRTAIVVILTGLSFLLLGAKEERPVPTIPPVGIEVTVQPSAMDAYQLLRRATPSTYTCEVYITKPGTKGVFATSKVIVKPGEKETSTIKTKQFDATFSVRVNRSRNRAAAEVVISREGTVMFEQKSYINLSLPTDRAEPAD
jgi:hypothetical protein